MQDCQPFGSNHEMPLDSSSNLSDGALALGAEHGTDTGNIKDLTVVCTINRAPYAAIYYIFHQPCVFGFFMKCFHKTYFPLHQHSCLY